MQKVKNEIFCLPCCRSIEHAEEIITAILRGNEDQALAFMCWRCSNYKGLVDEAGRTALHIASSCGKTRVLRWLLKDSENINLKDWESGYTPLHRSMFHGQLNAARYLIMHGARLDLLDNDGLTALDHATKDKKKDKNYPEVKLGITPWKGSTNPTNEVYVWGSNSNFNLGIGNHQIRRQPDTIDFFWKNKISIKRVAMGKFHSLFLCEDGRLYSCGLGQGGRLGLDSEETVMTPNQINISAQSLPSSSKLVVINVSVGQDHSLLITDKGVVYSFGMNDFYQLGLNPPPPFQLSPKALPLILRQPVGVSAAHYHSVAWSQTDLYTWGYNCGQLGYKTPNKYQITPKLVPNFRNASILAVASADSAIVVVTSKGDIFLLRSYGCLKIGAVSGLVRRIEISGGRLDPALIKSADVSGWGDYRTGEDDLKVLAVVWEEKTMFWQSSTSRFSRCCFQVGNRFLKVVDAALGINKLIVVTDEHEAYETDIVKVTKMQEKGSSPAEPTPLQKLVEKDSPVVFHMKRILCAYRATNAYCDPKGLNFALIQVNPIFLTSCPQELKSSGLENSLLSLLQEATESDYISDVVFSVAGFRIPAHRYVLETNCTKLASMVNSAEMEQMTSLLQNLNMDVHEDDDSKNRNILTVKLDNIHPLVFTEILKYIYSGQFDYCTPSDWTSEKDTAYANVLLSNEALMLNSSNHKSETVEQNSSKEKLPSKKISSKDKNTCSEKTLTFDYNPVVDARRTAVYFELKELAKRLDNMVYNKKKCVVFWKSEQKISGYDKRKVCLNLQCFQNLYDVVIECSEGKIISAHKCILTMRSKYFDTMLKGNWLECKEKRNLYLPFPYDVMEAILVYLYQDKVPFTTNVEDVAFICQVLVAADHILVDGLKLTCEITLGHLLTLKNVSELYKFSDTYSAYQLRSYCLKFIVPNISALLESRALDTIDDDLFTDIQLTYWEITPIVLERSIGIPIKYPDLEQLQSILDNVGVPLEEEHFSENGAVFKSQPKKEGIDTPKKRKSGKKHKLKKSSIDERVEPMAKPLLDSSLSDNIGAAYESSDAAIVLNMAEDESPNFSQDCMVENTCRVDTESKSKETLSPVIPSDRKTSFVTPKKEIPVSPQIEKEFPSLTGDMHQPSPASSSKVPKQRMAKLSQKARKKLRATAGVADVPQESPSESVVEQNAWKRIGSDSQEEHLSSGLEVLSLSEIMNEERMRCPRPQRNSFRESFSEDNSSSSAPSSGATRKWSSRLPNDESKDREEKPFDEIMADELKQREMTKKIMEKSLDLTQIEDKAIKELQLLYEKEYGFEEYITVRRRSSAQASKPVWKTTKTP